MRKIKIVATLIFSISLVLVVLFSNLSDKNIKNSKLITKINQQKALTQEISKNIFYITKNKNSSTFQLDINKKSYKLSEISSKEIKKQSAKIAILWDQFYTLVETFQEQRKVTTAYSNIILEKIVKDIYNTNLKLIFEFDKLLKISKKHIERQVNFYKYIQYTLFLLLVSLLIYLFTQIQSILSFIQKFLYTSTKIRKNGTIKELQPIDIENKSLTISKATDNFNYLVENINQSIQNSSNLMRHSSESLATVEKNIEDFINLIEIMEQNKEVNEELNKKEDALIQSLEELTSSSIKLQNLTKDLDQLISHYKK